MIIHNQVIDLHLLTLKPVGVLTNLNTQEIERVLVPRIMERLTMDGGIWMNFERGSNRGKASHV